MGFSESAGGLDLAGLASERGALAQHLQRTIYSASTAHPQALWQGLQRRYNGVKALWPAVVPAGPGCS